MINVKTIHIRNELLRYDIVSIIMCIGIQFKICLYVYMQMVDSVDEKGKTGISMHIYKTVSITVSSE